MAEANGFTIDDLTGYANDRPRAWARQEAMFVLRKTTSLSSTAIGALLNRDHSTVLYGINRVEKRLQGDPAYVGALSGLIREIMAGRRDVRAPQQAAGGTDPCEACERKLAEARAALVSVENLTGRGDLSPGKARALRFIVKNALSRIAEDNPPCA